jgi:hypothetical protein
MGKQSWITPGNPCEPVCGPAQMALQLLVLPTGPADQGTVQLTHDRIQRRAIIAPVVLEPAPPLRVEPACELLQRLIAAHVQPPTTTLRPHLFARFVSHRRTEGDEALPLPVLGSPGTQCLAQAIEPLVQVRPSPVLILAGDDLRLFRMKLQPACRHPHGHGSPPLLGFRLCPTVHNRLSGLPCKWQMRIGPLPPPGKGIVHKQIGHQGTLYTSYKVANILVEFATSMPRTQRRPGYGAGCLGAPLQTGQRPERRRSQQRGGRRGTSSTHANPGNSPHVCTESCQPRVGGAGLCPGGFPPAPPRLRACCPQTGAS